MRKRKSKRKGRKTKNSSVQFVANYSVDCSIYNGTKSILITNNLKVRKHFIFQYFSIIEIHFTISFLSVAPSSEQQNAFSATLAENPNDITSEIATSSENKKPTGSKRPIVAGKKKVQSSKVSLSAASSKMNNQQKSHDFISSDSDVANEKDRTVSSNKTVQERHFSIEFNDGKDPNTNENVAPTLKKSIKRSRNETQSQTDSTNLRKKSKRENQSQSQDRAIECDSSTCDNKQQCGLEESMDICESLNTFSNINSDSHGQTPANFVAQNVRLDSVRKIQGVRNGQFHKTTQLIPALPLKTKLPRIPKLRPVQMAEDNLVTTNFG